MGCTSSRYHVRGGKRSNRRWIAPELHVTSPPKHLTSSSFQVHGISDPKSWVGPLVSSSEAKLARESSTQLSIEPPEKDLGKAKKYSWLNYVSASKQIPEEEATTPKIGAFYGNQPEVIDIDQLMEGLEDAEYLSCSSFRVPRTNKHQIHTRSSSLSDIPSPRDASAKKSCGNSKTGYPKTRRRQSFSRFQHRYLQHLSSSAPGESEAKNFSSTISSDDITCPLQIQDTLTVIKEVVESQDGVESQSTDVIIKQLPDQDATDEKLIPKRVDIESLAVVDVSEKSPEQEFSKKSIMAAADHSSQTTKSLEPSLTFATKSSSAKVLKEDKVVGADASDEFSFVTESPVNDDSENISPPHAMDLIVAFKEIDQEREVCVEDFSIGINFTFFPNIPLHSLRYLDLGDFEKRVPPRGENKVVLYASCSSEIRKTYEDCNLVRQILCSYYLDLDERDISLHPEFEQELQRTLQKNGSVSLPRLFIKGRYIGGIQEVCLLHKAKALERLLQMFSSDCINTLCVCCGGTRSIQCLSCNGICLIKTEQGDVISCSECEEKGWTTCPICS